MAECNECGMEIPQKAHKCPYCRTEVDVHVWHARNQGSKYYGIPQSAVDILEGRSKGSDELSTFEAQATFNWSEAQYAFCFLAVLNCFLAGNEEENGDWFAYTRRALPILGIFKGVGDAQIGVLWERVYSDLKVFENSADSITDAAEAKIRLLKSSGRVNTIFTFILLVLAHFKDNSEKQGYLLADIGDVADFDFGEGVKSRMSVLR